MSTNYYVLTKDKSLIEKYGLNYELTDEPDWGYYIHLCQTCGNITPLFQAHKNIKDIDALIRFINEPTLSIYDEYNRPMTVDDFITHCINYYENNPNVTERMHTSDSYWQPTYFRDYRGFDFCEDDFA